MAYDFKYIRTGTGELPGPSMIWQTEQALTQIGTYADEANTKADEALETANTALNKANEAAEAAERAQNTADAAQAAASHAQDTADAAQSAAGGAQNTANKALETAQKGVADAAKAQTAANKAQASADAAQTAADTAQLTADRAQNAADKAQGTAAAAQKTATIALDTANNSQSSANVAQDTADNALLVSQSTQQAFYKHVREYTTQIAQALGEFEADSTTVDFDNFTNPIKLYITSPDASITIPDSQVNASITTPDDQVNAPFYLWNFTTDDRSSTAQFVYAANGLEYSRYGTIGRDSLIPGTDTYTLKNNSKNATLKCTGVASGMSIAKGGTLVNTWTASDTRPSYILGTWVITGIANGTISLNGVTIATLSDTGFYPTGQQQLQEDNTSFVIENMTYSATDGLTITAAVQWLNFDSQITWDSWKASSDSGDAVATDGVTIRYNSASNLQAKDIAINGDERDLASARGQIGDAKEKPNLDFNKLTTPGNYRITGKPKNGPTGISGASIGSLFVSGMPGNSNHLFQIMVSENGIYWRASISGGTTWKIWNQVLTGNKIGDGIRNTNGVISVPEMQGATSAQAGVSGLVPPPLAADAGKVLRADGTWSFPKDVAIGGDLKDLASARGQIGPARELGNNVDFNTVTEAGLYLINATGSVNAPQKDQTFFLQVVRSAKGAITKNLFQIAYNYSSVADLVFIRQYRTASSSWSVWTQFITSSQVGDGIRVTNGIISVPGMRGATASAAGTSGLVPPAAAGQHESFLTGGGKYKSALTKISDSVSLADSKTAASAKAVKTAYDLANRKQTNLGFTPVQQGGGTGQEPDHKVYLGWNSEGLAVQVDSLNLGNIITTKAGKQLAPAAERANKLEVGPSIYASWLYESIAGQPSYLWGSNDGINMRVFNPANLSVNYANSAGSVSGLGSARVSGVVSRCGDEICIHAPAGGQYLVLYGQRVAVTKGHRGGELYASLSPGIYAGGSHLGQTENRENDDAHMVTYAGELYRV